MTSTIKVNTIQDSCGSALVSKCSSTITLGASGKTVALATGASQSGFGRTGTVDWQTTPKTGDFTGANGEGYFINTTSGQITMTLPSASAGDIISIQDYNNTFDSNNFIVQAPSGVKINGGTAAGSLRLSTEGQGLTLIYVDSTVGWRSIESTTFASVSTLPAYVTATGGNTVSTSGDYKIHVFTGPGTFCVSCAGNVGGSNTVDYLVVAGGGGTPGLAHSNTPSGGGGAGGFRASATTFSIGCQPAKPLVCGVSALPVSATGFPITVGAGGAGGSAGPGNAGSNGANSIFSTITSTGGGAGGHGCLGPTSDDAGKPGGSGGGGGKTYVAGTGNTPPVSPPQGNDGGVGSGHPTNPAPYTVDNTGLGGGGGAIQAGFNGGNHPNNPPNAGGDGGDGAGFASGTWGSTGEVVSCVQYYSGGGAGGVYTPNPAPGPGGIGGLGGGGNGGSPANPSCVTSPARVGEAGTANTGGGGASSGGAPSPSSPFVGQAGGSGIVVIRYKYQN